MAGRRDWDAALSKRSGRWCVVFFLSLVSECGAQLGSHHTGVHATHASGQGNTCCSAENKWCSQTFAPPMRMSCPAAKELCCEFECDAITLETVVARFPRRRERVSFADAILARPAGAADCVAGPEFVWASSFGACRVVQDSSETARS